MGAIRGDGPGAPPDHKPDAARQDYWSELPAFLRAAEDHIRRWPTERVTAAVDRSRDPAGSWRGDGNQYLDPHHHSQAKDVIALVYRREEKLTEHMSEADRDPSCGAWLVGLEHRLKGEGRLKEKIANLVETGAPDATANETLNGISDAIRYTFCAKSGDYREVYWDIKNRLESRGLEMHYSQNHWESTQYKGINTRWITPEGQRFEIQFHTPESFHAKQELTHWAYERLRNPLTRHDEREELMAFQKKVCSSIPAPEGVEEIPDYRKEGP